MPYCPDTDEVFDSLMSLLPRGRAWQTHDATIARETSVLMAFMYGLAAYIKEHVEDDLCQAFDEMFCSTASVDLDLWQQDYGLPDDCDPFGDNLCAKVLAIGGTSLEYYVDIAAQLGWATTMRWLKGDDEEFPGVVSTLFISIDISESDSGWTETRFSNWVLGESRLGSPDTSALSCALDRIIPAHAAIAYEIV